MKRLWIVGVVILAATVTAGAIAQAQPEFRRGTCNHHCQFERDRAKLRKQTSRQPVPSYITDCESGGSYRAWNPSSGAGGKYQALPSTWRANLPRRRIVRLAEDVFTPREEKRRLHVYGSIDKGPRWSTPLLQDIVGDNIWDASGPGAWDCA